MNSKTERRIAKHARDSAKLICQLRSEGQHEAAAKIEAVAIQIANSIRQGAA